jgi:hypothetical protein
MRLKPVVSNEFLSGAEAVRIWNRLRTSSVHRPDVPAVPPLPGNLVRGRNECEP